MQELKRLRNGLGWSQQRLADESGVNKATINQVEQGKRSPSIATLESLARAMGAEVGDFFPKAQASLPFEAGGRENEILAVVSMITGLVRAWQDGLEELKELDSNARKGYSIAAADATTALSLQVVERLTDSPSPRSEEERGAAIKLIAALLRLDRVMERIFAATGPDYEQEFYEDKATRDDKMITDARFLGLIRDLQATPDEVKEAALAMD